MILFFIKKTEVCNFVKHTTIYSSSLNYEDTLKIMTHKLFQTGFKFIRSSINNNNITFIVENKHIKSTNEVKLLENIIDHKLTFTKHINNLCNTASKTFESSDKNKKIFISRANKMSFWGLNNVDFQILSSNMGVLW